MRAASRSGPAARMLRLSDAITASASVAEARAEVVRFGALVAEARSEDRGDRRERLGARHPSSRRCAPTTKPRLAHCPSGGGAGVAAPTPRATIAPDTVSPPTPGVAPLRLMKRLGIARRGEHEHALAVPLGERRTCPRSVPTPRNGFTVSASASSGEPGVSHASA